MQYLRTALSYAYAFKPGRTFAQVLAAELGANAVGILDADWKASLSVAGLAALAGFLHGWSDGSSQIAESTVSDKILGKA